jgi:hypothetical protein
VTALQGPVSDLERIIEDAQRRRVEAAVMPLTTVCAWCTPRAELEAMNRQFPSQVSHGCCKPCQQRVLAEAQRARAERTS